MIGQPLYQLPILEKPVEGGIGMVYILEDALLDRRVASKTLTADVT
jgi:hypothetical protein